MDTYFSKNSYYQESFSGISILNSTIKAKEFEQCKFKNSSFINCKFINSRFVNCKFVSCILSAINPSDSRFIEISFTNCKVIGFDWTKTLAANDLDFKNSQINYSNFVLLRLPNIKIVACEAKEVDFTEADLNGGTFNNTDFEKTVFFKTNLTKANFKGAKNYQIDPRYNTLKKTRFSLPEALSLLNCLDIIIE